jgi:hypothetical protein
MDDSSRAETLIGTVLFATPGPSTPAQKLTSGAAASASYCWRRIRHFGGPKFFSDALKPMR